jgi:starvation-inducible DNA-binding protein
MYRTRNDLSMNIREKMVGILNTHLADLIDLRTHAKVAHWNVKGPQFAALHKLFDDIAESVDEYADLVAERAVQLGGIVRGTARQVAATTELEEYTALGGMEEHVAAVANALAGVGSSARRLIDETAKSGDQGTADIFTEISRGIDKWLWMVEAHLQDEERVSRARDRSESAASVSP